MAASEKSKILQFWRKTHVGAIQFLQKNERHFGKQKFHNCCITQLLAGTKLGFLLLHQKRIVLLYLLQYCSLNGGSKYGKPEFESHLVTFSLIQNHFEMNGAVD